METADKTNYKKSIFTIALLLLITWGLHELSFFIYEMEHAARHFTISLPSEAIITFSILALWIGYFPAKKVWIKTVLAISVLLLHWLSTPVL